VSASNILANIALPDVDLENKISILTRVPSVSGNGIANFSEANVPSYVKNVVDDSVNITGSVHFNFDCSSNNVIVLNSFNYSGTFPTGTRTAKIDMLRWEVTAVPWLSPLFIFCFALLIATIFMLNISKVHKLFRKKQN
jgi:hypothetical protein